MIAARLRSNAVQLTPEKFSHPAEGRSSGPDSTTWFPRKCCWANGCERAIPKQP